MKRVTLKDIQTMANAAFPELWKEAKQMGRDVKIYLHLTTISTLIEMAPFGQAQMIFPKRWLIHGTGIQLLLELRSVADMVLLRMIWVTTLRQVNKLMQWLKLSLCWLRLFG